MKCGVLGQNFSLPYCVTENLSQKVNGDFKTSQNPLKYNLGVKTIKFSHC